MCEKVVEMWGFPPYTLFIQLWELEADWEGWGANSKIRAGGRMDALSPAHKFLKIWVGEDGRENQKGSRSQFARQSP